MTEIQKALLELLKEIDSICKKYQIEYYLGGGTFIGAVRHGSFLPWDDDADVHMSRDNAWRFVKALEIEKIPNRIVYTGTEDGTNTLAHWRYENTQTTALLRHLTGTSDPKAQFVDIIVNYPLPLNEKKRNQCIDEFKLYCELKNNNFTWDSRKPRKFLRKYNWLVRIQKIVGRKRLLDYFERRIFNYPEKGATHWLIRSPGLSKQGQPKELWGTPRFVPFEDTMLPVAEQAEKLLCYVYGPTWFEVPAYTERENHVIVADLEIPYSVYIEYQNRYFDSARFYAEEIKKKGFWFSMLENRNTVIPQLRFMQGICFSLQLQNTIISSGVDLNILIEQKRAREVQEIFAPYFSKIYSSPFQYYGIYIDLPDEYLYAALYFQCFDGNYGIASKILNSRRTAVNRALSTNLQRLCHLCDATAELLNALYGDLDLKTARTLVDNWLEKEPTALYFMRADVYLRLNNIPEEAAPDLLRRCEQYLNMYPDDGELLKYRGDLMLSVGQVEEAEKCYQKAICNLKNGFCIKAIKAYFAAKSLEVAG